MMRPARAVACSLSLVVAAVLPVAAEPPAGGPRSLRMRGRSPAARPVARPPGKQVAQAAPGGNPAPDRPGDAAPSALPEPAAAPAVPEPPAPPPAPAAAANKETAQAGTASAEVNDELLARLADEAPATEVIFVTGSA